MSVRQQKPRSAKGSRPNQRKHRRLTAEGPGKLVHRYDEAACELVNLSYGGACISYPNGLVPSTGEPVQIRFADGSSVVGRIAWIADQKIGVSFSTLVPDIHDRTDAASDGAGYFKRIVSFQIARHRG